MRREFPATNEYIDYLTSSGKARPLHSDTPPTDENDWIYDVIEGLDLDERQADFLRAIGAGHTIADAARLVGRTPRWGRNILRTIRSRASELR